MDYNYSCAGIAVALKDQGCRLIASMREVNRLKIVSVVISQTLAGSKGMWVFGYGQNSVFERALREAEASYLINMAEWCRKLRQMAYYRRSKVDPGSHLNDWILQGGELWVWHENGSYIFELRSIGSMKPGWRVLRFITEKLDFDWANEIARLELSGLKSRNSQIKIIAG